MKYTAVVGGKRVEIELNRNSPGSVEARIGGRPLVIELAEIGPGVYWFNWNNRSIEVAVRREGDIYFASINNCRISVEMLDPRAALRRGGPHSHDGVIEVRAPMHGKVIRLLVAEGTPVQANQGLVVVEAMKMQNEIKTPKPGIVKRLAVTEGATVNSGELLATVE